MPDRGQTARLWSCWFLEEVSKFCRLFIGGHTVRQLWRAVRRIVIRLCIASSGGGRS